MMGTRSWDLGLHNPHVLQSRLPTWAGHKTTGRPLGVVYCWPSHSCIFRICGLLAPGALWEVMVTAALQPASTASSASASVSHDAMASPLRWAPFVLKKCV